MPVSPEEVVATVQQFVNEEEARIAELTAQVIDLEAAEADTLSLGTLGVNINATEARITLPSGEIVTRPFPISGEIAMRLGLGLALTNVAAQGGGGDPPEPPYHADAVHFDGAIEGQIAALVASTSPQWSTVCFFRAAAADAGPIYNAGEYLGYTWLGGAAAPHLDFLVAPEVAGAYSGAYDNIVGGPALNVWHSLVATTDQTTGEIKIFVDRVDVTDIIQDASPIASIPVNGLPFFVGSDGLGTFGTFDLADLRVMPGVSLLSGGTISAATLDLFVTADNKPVNPAVATASLGAAGAVLLSGGASAWTAGNQGVGGAISWTGTLIDAASSPSD